jgi:hypothetical protein
LKLPSEVLNGLVVFSLPPSTHPRVEIQTDINKHILEGMLHTLGEILLEDRSAGNLGTSFGEVYSRGP